MTTWTVVPCLLVLRDEFNLVSPKRDKGADGTIGDTAHNPSSDHTPDEDSQVLRDHDADKKNEVHALDIDSTGPWPNSGWFNRTVLDIVDREKADYESPTIIGRLQYVIHNRRIASRSWGWTWREYKGTDPHTGHAHFSARYLAVAEASTRPWGVYEEEDMASAQETWDHLVLNPYTGKKQPVSDLLAWVGSRQGIGEEAAKQVDPHLGEIEAKLDALSAKVDQLIQAHS